jgi:diguanylate cyclase (GGDEF)-like protein/PAS domain S-box-containing protein
VGERGSSYRTLTDAAQSRIDDYCLIADLTGTDLFVIDPVSLRFLACNTSAHEHLGYSRQELLSLDAAAIQADPDHDAAWLLARIQEMLPAGSHTFLTRHRCRDNSITDVEVSNCVIVLDGQQKVLSVVRDRTEVQQREKQLQDTVQLLVEGETMSGIGVWDFRFADGRMRWSQQMRHLCHSNRAGEITTLWAYGTLVHPDDRNRWRQDFQRAVVRGEGFLNRHRIICADGAEMVVEQEAHISYDHDGQPVRAVGTLRDLGQYQRLLDEQSWQRSYDPLTGLPNKLASLQELDQRLRGRSYSNSMAVLSLDVDGFQEINDNFGSDVGDQLLKAMARRLEELLGSDTWIGRLSSDQFLIILEANIHALGDAVSASRNLQQLWSKQQGILSSLPLVPTFSIGLATYPEHGQVAKTLLECANTALMKAKSLGRVQVCTYSSTISRQIEERMQLTTELTNAINQHQFRIVVQPQLDLANRIDVGEVLLRWTNHRGTSVPPSYFIPLAEESGLIVQISDWVLNTTLQQLSRWRIAGLQTPRLALNLSPRELDLPGRRLISFLLDGLSKYGLSPEQLELEITETALLSNPLMAREQLRVLADQGFRIAIDDFGTGYSSLELLRNLPVHRLKIDRIFVQSMTASSQDQTIVRTAITLAKGLGMDCVAEGVETDEQRQMLADLGCDYFQGYLYGLPLELNEFEALLTGSAVPAGLASQTAGRPTISTSVRFDQRAEDSGIPSTFEQLEVLRMAFDAAEDPFLLLQALPRLDGSMDDFLILEANQAVCTALRQEREAIVGQSLLTTFPQVRQNGLLDLCLDAASRNAPVSITDFVYRYGENTNGENPNREKQRDERSFDIQILPTKGFLVTTWRDVTTRARAARSLADSAALYRLLTDNIVEVVALFNEQEQVIWVSPSLQPMTGWNQEQWQGKRFRELFASAEGAPEPVELGDWLQQGGLIRQGRLRLADPKGGWSWVRLSVRRLKPDGLRSLDGLDDVPIVQGQTRLEDGFVLTLQPVDEQVMEERRLLKRANTDPLTGLESRATILGWLEQRLLDANGRTAQPLALLFCDFDDFKGINDTYGHACGDVVLQTVAERIASLIRQRDHAGRLGGDEFLVLLEGIHNLADAQRVATKLHDLFSDPIPWRDQQIRASVSIGLAFHSAGEDAELFLKRAYRNMYGAKASGRGRVVSL